MSFESVGFHASLNVLLVPVSPIKRSTYESLATQVKRYHRIALRDVPADPRGERAALSASARSNGYLLLSFVDTFERWDGYLEDFEPNRRLFGVLGIADCEEWDSLHNANAEFQQTLRRYPRAVSSRCYAFNPKDGHKDEVDGVVTIPNVGDTGFYISTLLADFASTLLYELSNMVAALDAKAIFHSPIETEAPDSPYNFVPDSPRGKASSAIKEYAMSSSKSTPELSSAAKGEAPLPKITTTVSSSESPVVDMRSPALGLPPPPQSRMATSLGGGTSPGNQEGVLFGQNINSQFRPSVSAGAGDASDKTAKRRTLGRASKLRGDLYALAGRWAEALTFYGEAIATARTVGDPLWEAAAVERQLLTTVLVAWQPHVPELAPEHATPRLDMSTRSMSQEAIAQAIVAAREVPEKYRALLEAYIRLLPGQGASDTLPTALLIEAALRSAAIQLALLRHNGWTAQSMTDMVEGTMTQAPRELKRLSASSTNASGITKALVAESLSYAYIPQLASLPIPQRLMFLNAVASFFGVLGFVRKRAAVLREVAAIAGEASRQARAKARASGAASKIVSTAPETSGNEAIVALLQQVCDAYGLTIVARTRAEDSAKRVSLIGGPASRKSGVASFHSDSADDGFFGWPDLQVAVVRDAISICEMLPDYASALRFTISALRETSAYMPSMDQLQLSQNIPAIFSNAARRGATFALDYWGPTNLLVSLEIIAPNAERRPIEHSGAEVEDSGTSGPFIYSARPAKRSFASAVLLVQNDAVEINVTLQNPFMFDLEIRSIELSTTGVDFATSPIAVTIPPGSYHTVRLFGTPREAGKLVFRGCRVQLVCSESREFLLPISNEAKAIAERKRQSLELMRDRLKGGGLALLRERTAAAGPKADLAFLECRVVPEQPALTLKASSLTHGALMLYDGEHSSIQLVLENSSSMPVNFVKLSFSDSYTAAMQARLRDAEMPAGEAYELDLEIRRRPVFAWTAPEEPIVIQAGLSAVLTIQVYGKLGCSEGTVQIDYANVDMRTTASSTTFFGRRLSLDVFMTVHRALEAFTMTLQRLQAPMSAEPLHGRPEINGIIEHAALDPALEDSFKAIDEDQHCLLAVDVRNVYGQPFEVAFVRRSEESPLAVIRQRIEPGATSTILLRLDRLRLDAKEIAAPLPSIADRQFVVSKTATSAGEEATARELFWYREAFLQSLKATWRELGTFRQGDVSLRALRLSRPMLDVLRLDQVSISLSLEANVSTEAEKPFEQYPPNRPAYRTHANDYVDICAAITNATERMMDMLVRFDTLPGIGRPPESQRSVHDDDDETLDHFVMFDGIPWTALRSVKPGATVSARVPAVFLAAGRFEVGCSVEADGMLYTSRRPLAIEVR